MGCGDDTGDVVLDAPGDDVISVWKYPVAVEDEFSILMPKDAEVLKVDTQNGAPYLWALVDTERGHTHRHFMLRGTGHSIPEDVRASYVGTFQLHGGLFVGHLWETL